MSRLIFNDAERAVMCDAAIDARNSALDSGWRSTPDEDKVDVYADFVHAHNLTDTFVEYRRQWVRDGLDAASSYEAAA